MIICRRCNIEKLATEFARTPNNPGGRMLTCKTCQRPNRMASRARCPRIRTKEQRQAERARQKAKIGKAYIPGHVGRHRRRDSQEPIGLVAARKAWTRWLKRAPTWWLDAYWTAHPTPWHDPRLSIADKRRMRRRLDVHFALALRLKERIKGAARKRGIRLERVRATIAGKDSYSIPRKFGYTVEELKAHVERSFTSDMTWDAFLSGDIHIDHIVPLRVFDITNDEDIRKAWSLSNLQPMWARDNLAKAGKVSALL